MPSSPERRRAHLEPAELVDDSARPALRVAPAPVFEPLTGAVHAPADAFEVVGAAAVPPALLDPARRAAVSAGYAAGWAEGLSTARSMAERDTAAAAQRSELEAAAARGAVDRALRAVGMAAGQLHDRDVASAADVERLIIAAAFDIAEAVVGECVRRDPARGATAVARALALTPDTDEVVVALHPADRAALLASGAPVPAHVRLVDGGTLEPGDAIATAGATTVDARIAAGLQRVRAVFGG